MSATKALIPTGNTACMSLYACDEALTQGFDEASRPITVFVDARFA